MFGRSGVLALAWLLCNARIRIHGQTDNFEIKCDILKTLETLQTRLEDQDTRLREQETTLEEYNTRLVEQETSLEEHETRLVEQETRLRDKEEEIANLKRRLQTNEDKTYPIDCGEINDDGTTTSGVYIISPDGRCPFNVYCDMTDCGWTVIQRRIDGAVNFRRTWDEYVQGFGDVDGEYWLGLESIHILTKDGHEIYFDLENNDGTKYFAHYKFFTVQGLASLYTMNVDVFGYNGTIAELFSFQNGQGFSTFDRDNDAYDTTNCAEYFGGGGWWYERCYKLGNLNGVFGKKALDGMNYYNGAYVYIRAVTLQVKQREEQCLAYPSI